MRERIEEEAFFSSGLANFAVANEAAGGERGKGRQNKNEMV